MKYIDERFFSIISHDLKSPFNSLLGFTQLLKDNFDKYDDKKKKQIINILHKTSKDAYRFIDNLLLWIQSEKEQLDVKPEKILLFEFVEASLKKLNEIAITKEITLLNLVPKDLLLEADKEILKTVINNLVLNAIKYTSKNGEVKIQAEQIDDSIEIHVLDNGVGIPEKIQDKLFTFDKEIIRIGTANEKGNGLGLLVCKSLVERHKGQIRINDNNEATDISFTIPLSNFNKKDKEIGATDTKKDENPIILVAEDDEANYFLLETLLNDFELEFEVMHVVNGEEAVKLVNIIPEISLILMDMKMPVMDGYEATKLIKEKHPEIPIIAQTAYTTNEDKAKAFAAGCDAIISKPIDAKELYTKIINLQ